MREEVLRDWPVMADGLPVGTRWYFNSALKAHQALKARVYAARGGKRSNATACRDTSAGQRRP